MWPTKHASLFYSMTYNMFIAKIPLQRGRNFEYFQQPQVNGLNINPQESKLTQMESILWHFKNDSPLQQSREEFVV